jgi:hypothetical protein
VIPAYARQLPQHLEDPVDKARERGDHGNQSLSVQQCGVKVATAGRSASAWLRRVSIALARLWRDRSERPTQGTFPQRWPSEVDAARIRS